MPTLPGAMLEFLAAVDEAMVVLKSSHIGKIAEISAYIRDVYAWRRSPPALLLVDKLVEAVEGLSAGDIGGERGFGPGPGRFAGEGSARIYHPNLVEALHLTHRPILVFTGYYLGAILTIYTRWSVQRDTGSSPEAGEAGEAPEELLTLQTKQQVAHVCGWAAFKIASSLFKVPEYTRTPQQQYLCTAVDAVQLREGASVAKMSEHREIYSPTQLIKSQSHAHRLESCHSKIQKTSSS
jgi:hypothetical protein